VQLSSLLGDRRIGRRGRWILLSAIVGAVSGIGAILFDILFRFSQSMLLERVGRFGPPTTVLEGGEAFGPEQPWLLPVSLAVGGLLSGLLVYFFAPEAEGHGTDSVIRAFHHGLGKVRKRVAPIKALASAITIGSGGSAGREGPIAQIGASFGSFLGDLLRLTHHDRRIMMMAGMAGGIGSIFRAPLGASFFAAEVLYSKPEFEYEVLLPGLISAITGYSIYSSYAGWGFLFDVPEISFHEPKHLPAYLALGVACALAGAIYPKFFYGVRDKIFRPMGLPGWLKPAIGGTALGLIAVYFPAALGMGYGYIQQAIEGSLTIQYLADDLIRRLGRCFWPEPGDRRGARRCLRHVLRRPGPRLGPRTRGLRDGRDGWFLRRCGQDALRGGHHGHGDDGVVRPARPQPSGRHDRLPVPAAGRAIVRESGPRATGLPRPHRLVRDRHPAQPDGAALPGPGRVAWTHDHGGHAVGPAAQPDRDR
jgi:H+/Cl- antiporter ClcA